MSVIVNLVALVWLIRIVANFLSYIHLWWVKEYRFDRMLIHLKTNQRRKILFIFFRIPPRSPKTLVLFLFSVTTLAISFTTLGGNIFLRLFLLDVGSFLIVSFWVTLLKFPTYIYHEFQIWRAVRKLRAHKKLRVIGITGSYGKTSTKEFLATILSSQYKVLKTEASKNSLIGIAEVVLAKLRPDHEVFIVEMGAYKSGEISRICQIVKPSMGIITAINPQHQDLFDSIENTIKAKYELIKSLPIDGIGIFNADNIYALQMAEKAYQEGKRVWLFNQKSNKIPVWPEKIVSAENIKSGFDDVAFTIKVDNQKVNTTAKVLGAHQVSNILAAIAASLNLGMKMTEIAKAVTKIRPFAKTMQPIKGVNGSSFINDTFNNNPDAALKALDYLAKTRGRKILVFQPMIELGKYAAGSHEEVGKLAAQICDQILLTNDSFLEFFEKGVKSVDPKKIISVVSPAKGAEIIKKTVGKEDTVLFKGKEAEKVINLLV